jgi:uncharacterized protein YxeA
MKTILMIISLVALVVVCAGPTLHTFGLVSRDIGQWGIFVGTIGWFASAPFWIRRQ